MRIRHVLPEPELGVLPLHPLEAPLTGVVNGTLHLAIHQAAGGHQVEIVCPTEDSHAHAETVKGVHIRWLPLWKRARLPRYDLRYLLPLLLFTLRSGPVDITHVYDNPFLLVQLKSRGAVLHHKGLVLRGSAMYDRMERRADRVICISDHIRGEVLRKVAYPPEHVITVYDGIDRGPSATVDRAQARAHFHMSDQTVALLFAARMVPEKGLHILLQAFRAIHEAGHHQTELFVAGTTRLGYSSRTALDQIRPELSPYDQQIAALSAGLPVHFLGNIPFRELPLFYRAGDIFVCPSTWQEPFGRTNVEAMDAGLPIVASAVGGIPETVRHDYNGLLVPPEDVEALTQALTRLILDGALRQRFSQAGQEMIARFEWSVLTRQVEQIYEAILA